MIVAMSDAKLVRVHISFGGGNDVEGESIWAKEIPGEPDHYILDNIPFFAYGLNIGDVVRCVATKEYPREVVSVVRPSGNSTMRVAFDPLVDDRVITQAMDKIHDTGAIVECAVKGVYSISVNDDAYDTVLAWLSALEDDGHALYETCEESADGSFDAPLESEEE